ncbi:DUF6879 family protein [Streptomyces sp. NPDC127098]|uniref:DUF6879 family protein n=1 Tax=Streptomyces sp. NPDC127098 TaxID=3347137 RepID=UPI0036679D44
MIDLHPPRLDRAQGVRLDQPAYSADFWQRYTRLDRRDSWKLERGQHFVEQDSPSRAALGRGDWAEALRLLEGRRAGLREEAEQDRRLGTVFHRVRVVEKPFTPYIQWELHSLLLNAEDGGEDIRIVEAGELHALEVDRPLPELVVLGGETLYEVVYTDDGVLDGCVRFTDPQLVDDWQDLTRALFERGEDLSSYFAREVAPLPPPRLTTDEE